MNDKRDKYWLKSLALINFQQIILSGESFSNNILGQGTLISCKISLKLGRG